MDIIYSEKQKTYFLLISVFIIIAAFLLVLVFSPFWLVSEKEMSQGQRIIVLAAVIVDLVLFWSFSQLFIKLTEEQLQISFGVFRKKFKLNEIVDCRVEEFQLSRYLGYGIRFGFDKSIGYVARAGRGIRITLKQGRPYFFTTDAPEQLLQLIKQRIAKS